MGKRKRTKRKHDLTAKTADRHALYQKSVQDPAFEAELFERIYKRRVGRKPRALREDFCGTALLCAHWVREKKKRTAFGVDIDPEVLEWGAEHVHAELPDSARARLQVLEGDVRDRHIRRHDLVVALNYSYCCFKDRDTLRGYFEAVKSHLDEDGLFFLDLFGGWEAQQEITEKRNVDGFRYVWQQASYNPITADLLAHIHFHFGDGTKLRQAFTYDWRLWTLPEIQELLGEAGFEHVEVLWEDEDKNGEGNGVFRRRRSVSNDPGWNAYVMASVRVPPRVATKRNKKRVTG